MLKILLVKLPRSQKGTILVLSLVMLMIITIVGTSAMDMTTLNTKMDANVRDRQVALQAANAGLLRAEEIVDPLDGSFPIEGVSDGFVQDALPVQWWMNSASTAWGDSGATIGDYRTSGNVLFVIDHPEQKSADSMDKINDLGKGSGGPKPMMMYYPITTQGDGAGKANVMLQSIYARKKYLNN